MKLVIAAVLVTVFPFAIARADRPAPCPPPGPPPEAVDACRNAKLGDACSFRFGDHAISGTCAHGPDGNGPLACKPDRW